MNLNRKANQVFKLIIKVFREGNYDRTYGISPSVLMSYNGTDPYDFGEYDDAVFDVLKAKGWIVRDRHGNIFLTKDGILRGISGLKTVKIWRFAVTAIILLAALATILGFLLSDQATNLIKTWKLLVR